jgi:hypothetical protein
MVSQQAVGQSVHPVGVLANGAQGLQAVGDGVRSELVHPIAVPIEVAQERLRDLNVRLERLDGWLVVFLHVVNVTEIEQQHRGRLHLFDRARGVPPYGLDDRKQPDDVERRRERRPRCGRYDEDRALLGHRDRATCELVRDPRFAGLMRGQRNRAGFFRSRSIGREKLPPSAG